MKLRNILVALAFLSPALVIADDQINGIGGGYFSIRQAITTIACIRSADGGGICALFPAGDSWDHKNRVVVVTTDAAVRCCFTGTSPEDDGSLAITTGLSVTDTGGEFGSGQGNCFALESAGQEYHGRPDRNAMLKGTTGGARRGLCTTELNGANGSKEDQNGPDEGGIFQPCGDTDNDADADCADIDATGATVSAGTCNEDTILTGDASLQNGITKAQRARAGAELVCVCASGTCNVTVRKELVQR